MICSACGWLVLWNDRLTATKCEHCGSINCHVIDGEDDSTTEPPEVEVQLAELTAVNKTKGKP